MEDLNFNIEEKNKKILSRLVTDFGEDLLNGWHENITLYGTDREILCFFRNGIKNYLDEKGKRVSIDFERRGQYNIDVGFFLRAGYFKGINKDINILNQ